VTVIKAVALLVITILFVLFALWFERRLVGRFQSRLGPNVRGPLGLLQACYDAAKLLLKEDMNVTRADKLIYILAPMLSVFASLMVFAVIPFGSEVSFGHYKTPLQLTDFPVAALYILAVTAIGVYGIVLGGWASRGNYTLMGAVRSSAQLISYELVMGLSIVSVFLVTGSMSTSNIVYGQRHIWYCILLAPSFVMYMISIFGETNRLPFDLPECEGELVAGYQTEYSSMKFAWYYLAEYINMLNVSAVATTLFLGGYRFPFTSISALNTGWWTVVWFLIKMWAVMFLFVWVRGTLVRFRYDQFMRLGWKKLLPCALIWLFVLTAAMSAIFFIPKLQQRSWWWPLAILAVFGLIIGLVILWPMPAERPVKDWSKVPYEPYAGGFPVPPMPGQTTVVSAPQPVLAAVGAAPESFAPPGGAGTLPAAPAADAEGSADK
jgi:NADH-quinone oxidoreductase subunit H